MNAEGVIKQRKCDRMREQRRVGALQESENAILYEKSRNAESKSTENAIVCEHSGKRMLRESKVRENASLCEMSGAPEC